MAKLKLMTRKDVELKNEDLGLSLKLGKLMPEHVAEMREIFSGGGAASSTVAIYAMRHSISSLTNDGEELNPVAISYSIDTRDPDNIPFLMGISALVLDAALVSDEIKKKSGTPPSPTIPASDA